ncbi:MAG: DNA repair protein RecO [Candidatus Binatia bacterium]
MVFRARTHGESDKIITLLTRDFGKLTGIAKGALRSRRRFVASLEPFTHVRLGFRSRAHGELCFIESADIVRAARKLTFDLDRYAYSTYVVDLTDSLVEGREADAATFDLVEEALALIDGCPSLPAPEWLRAFEIRLLALAGLEPRLESCGRCRAAIVDANGPLQFNPRSGNLACRDCSDGAALAVSAEALAAILGLRVGPVGPRAELPVRVATEARVLLQTFIAHHVRRPLRSPALLREILG